MSFTLVFHSFNSSRRTGLARQLLLTGAALLLVGSTFAQTPAKSEKAPRILTVADSVQRVGSKISGGWREHAADGSWRRVEFVLDGEAASVTFGDGERGRRPPGASRYSYAGSGIKGEKETYTEAHSFAGASPALLAKANQSSPIPKGVATRIRELGGDFRLLQRLMDESRRLKELGSAFDAAHRPSDDGGVFGRRPGGSPGEGNWSDPRRGVGRGGQASDSAGGKLAPGGSEEVVSSDSRAGTDGSSESHVVVRHKDGSTTSTSTWSDSSGSGTSYTDKDKNGEVTGGGSTTSRADRSATVITYERDRSTGRIHYVNTTVDSSGTRVRSGFVRGGTPPESGGSGGSFDEAWLYKSAPWLMDALYTNWKRENDLLVSGGRITQPGRGESPPQAPGETNRVGANAVVNCGDSNTNPCAGAENADTDRDSRERLGALTQPPRDGLTGGPLGGGGGPFPPPNPQFQK